MYLFNVLTVASRIRLTFAFPRDLRDLHTAGDLIFYLTCVRIRRSRDTCNEENITRTRVLMVRGDADIHLDVKIRRPLVANVVAPDAARPYRSLSAWGLFEKLRSRSISGRLFSAMSAPNSSNFNALYSVD